MVAQALATVQRVMSNLHWLGHEIDLMWGFRGVYSRIRVGLTDLGFRTFVRE